MAKTICSICQKQIKMTMTRYTTKDKYKICKECGEDLKLDPFTTSKLTLFEVANRKAKFENNGPASESSCPNCNSSNVQFMQNNKKNFSVGKAVGGAVLTGGIGALAGFAGKKGQNEWRCNECGTIFSTK